MSTFGVLPACRTLDCVSIFSLTVDDAITALNVMAGYDAADPYSRDRFVGPVTGFPAGIRLGIPRKGQLKFFGDAASEAGYAAAIARSPRSARRWSNSISSHSTRPRGCSMKARGWRSAIW